MSELNKSQLCRFCQRSTNLSHYCEDCESSCCSDCLLERTKEFRLCQSCGSKNIEKDDNDRLKCKDCGSTMIKIVEEQYKACPNCKSTNIVNVFEKKESLEREFLDQIKKIQGFAEPFIKLKNDLEKAREKIRKARDYPITCYHYPDMEGKMVTMFKLFNETVNLVLDKINIHLHHFTINRDYFFDIHSQPNSSLRIIGGILKNLIRSHNSIEEFINNNVKTIECELKKIEENLKVCAYVTEYFLKFEKDLKLSHQEKPVYAIAAKLDNGFNPSPVIRTTRGYLFITNLDIMFVQTHLFNKKKKNLLIKNPIKDLQNIKATQSKLVRRRKIYLEFIYAKYEFVVRKEAATSLIDCILLAQAFDETIKLNENAANKLKRMVLDLNNIVNFIEEAINSFYALKCHYNKALGTNMPLALTDNSSFNTIQTGGLFSNNQQIMNNSNPSFGSCSQNQQFSQTPIAENQFIINSQREPSYSNSRIIDIEDRNRGTLIRRIGRDQVPLSQAEYYPGFYNTKNTSNNEWFHKAGLNRGIDPKNAPFIDPTYDTYNKYHLSDYFVPNPRNEDVGKKMRELKKERYNLNKTLSKLEARIELGLMSEDEYFKIYNNIQKRIAFIDKKLDKLKEDIHEEIKS
ncbi:MAG: B-box zinc finger protein [Promethearchaeota archaeon]